MGYFELVNRYNTITMEIGFLESQAKHDDDNAITRRLQTLRLEQKEAEAKINEYNGVVDEFR